MYHQVPPHSGQWPSQHLNTTAPLGGEMLWAASPEGRCLHFPPPAHTSDRPGKDSEEALLGGWRAHPALRPKVRQLQAGPSTWLLQTPLCKNATSTKPQNDPEAQTGEEQGPSLCECSWGWWEAVVLFSCGCHHSPLLTRSPGAEHLVTHLASNRC